MKIWIPATLIAIGLVGLITMGIVVGSIPELHVRDVLDGKEPGRKIKVHGKIEKIIKETRPISLVIRDKEDEKKTIAVVVDAERPDLFKVGNDVAVEGVFDAAEQRLNGRKISTQCPSKYEASEAGKSETAMPAASSGQGP